MYVCVVYMYVCNVQPDGVSIHCSPRKFKKLKVQENKTQRVIKDNVYKSF